MLLPPNMLLWEEEVADFNPCLQARENLLLLFYTWHAT